MEIEAASGQRIVLDIGLLLDAKDADALVGFDPGELQWLALHERSPDEHLAAVTDAGEQTESLLEFGEFLRRPARITQCLTWR